MEMLYTHSLPLIFAFILFVFTVIKTVKGPSKIPPGPWQLPFIGNIHQLVGSLPHHILKDLASKYGPLMSLKLGEVSAVVVSSAEIAEEIMKTHDINFADRPHLLSGELLAYNSSDILLSPYGEYWRQMRKITTLEVFSSKSVQKFQPIRREEVTNLIKFISQNEGSAINITQALFSLTTGVTARAVLGKKLKDAEVFASFLRETVELSSGFGVADMFPSFKFLHVISGVKRALEKLHKNMDRILENIINEHRDRKSEVEHQDLVDVLLSIQKQGHVEPSLADNKIKAIILSMMMSGINQVQEWALAPEVRSGSSCPELSHRFPEERETLSLDDGFDQTPVLKQILGHYSDSISHADTVSYLVSLLRPPEYSPWEQRSVLTTANRKKNCELLIPRLHLQLYLSLLSKICEGGPLINDTGHVVGVNFFYNFAHPLPTSVILTCMEMWRSFSTVVRPWIGMSVVDANQLSYSLVERSKMSLEDSYVVVKKVYKGSLADKNNIRSGDLVATVNGTPIRSAKEYSQLLLSETSRAAYGDSGQQSFTVVINASNRGTDNISIEADYVSVEDKRFIDW